MLDNFEQILSAAPVIAELLGAAPKLKALVTSREVLHLYGEQEYSVPPLSLPEPGRIVPIERLAQVEAVRLFIEQAEPLLYGPEQVVWFHRLDLELNNIYAALAWSMEGDPEIGLRIAGACWWHWRRRGHVREGLMWTERAIAAGRDSTPRARALLAAGCLEAAPNAAGNSARAAALFKESMALWRAVGDRAAVGQSLRCSPTIRQYRRHRASD